MLPPQPDSGGCDRALNQIDPQLLRIPPYACDGSVGRALKFWLYNTDVTPIAAGTRVGLAIEVGGVPQSEAFNHLLRVSFGGYANPTTGTLRTDFISGDDFPDVNLEKSFEYKRTDLIAPDALASGEAYLLSIRPQFDIRQLQAATLAGSTLSVYPFFYMQAGSYSDIGAALGEWIYPSDDRGFAVPRAGLSVQVLSRSGMVARRSFESVGAVAVSGLQPSTANQKIVLNGNGAAYLRSGALQTGEALRAIVGTLAGTTAPSPFSAATGSLGSLSVTLTYPSDGTTAQIRPNYPDTIAGLAGKATLNATQAIVYVKSGTTDSIVWSLHRRRWRNSGSRPARMEYRNACR
jgi:hypothetical protein